MEVQNHFDVLVIGAGAAGLLAALELALVEKKVAIVEAKDYAGGRIHTIENKRFSMPVEAGAEFIHGKLKLTQELLQKAGTKWQQTSGDMWRKQKGTWEKEGDFIDDYALLKKKFKQLKHDIPVAQFLQTHLSEPAQQETCKALKTYVEGYYAADTHIASTFALRNELQNSDEEQYRPVGGYKMIVQYLLNQLEQKGVPVFLSAAVSKITWEKNAVEVVAHQKSFKAQKILLTVSLGVLQSKQIQFFPALPQKMEAAKALGFGSALKIMLQFEESFWKDKQRTDGYDMGKAGFIFSDERVPTWWTQQPEGVPILAGWVGGPQADELKNCTDDELLQQALQSLSNLFTTTIAELTRKLTAWHVANWAADPYFSGGYSFVTVGDEQPKKILKQPVDNTLFFAGEGLYEGEDGGTVEAALHTGRETAQTMIASF